MSCARNGFRTPRANVKFSGGDAPLAPPASITLNQFEFSKHALDQSILRGITVQELREAIANGEVIEDYPDDKYGQSCLTFGMTKSSRPIHIQCSYPSRKVVKIITLYQPDSEQWIDYKVRR